MRDSEVSRDELSGTSAGISRSSSGHGWALMLDIWGDTGALCVILGTALVFPLWILLHDAAIKVRGLAQVVCIVLASLWVGLMEVWKYSESVSGVSGYVPCLLLKDSDLLIRDRSKDFIFRVFWMVCVMKGRVQKR